MSTHRRAVRMRRSVAPIVTAMVALSTVTGTTVPAHAAPPQAVESVRAGLRPENVRLSPVTPCADIQSVSRCARRPAAAMPRWALLATPCTSCRASTEQATFPLQFEVGYYTEVAGLGAGIRAM